MYLEVIQRFTCQTFSFDRFRLLPPFLSVVTCNIPPVAGAGVGRDLRVMHFWRS